MSSVLIVDDQTDMLEMLSRTLQSEFCVEITQANSGNEAINLLRNTAFDLVICDLVMPDGTGADVWYFLESHLENNSRFIMFTSNMDAIPIENWRERLIAVQKPNIRELVDAIRFLGDLNEERSTQI